MAGKLISDTVKKKRSKKNAGKTFGLKLEQAYLR